MKAKAIVYSKVDPKVLDYIRETCDVVYYDKLDSETYPSFIHELKDAQGLVGSELKVDEAFLDQAPLLKIVCNNGTGYDNLDIPELTKRNIMATNTPEVVNNCTADNIFGLLMSTARRMPELNQYVKSGQWKGPITEDLFGVNVYGKVLGIIGMGTIGSMIAKRAHFGFDMKIKYHNRSRNVEVENLYNASFCSLDELLKESDFVCLMTPSTPETEKIMAEREFKLMKETAIFINGSRGKNVDEEALIRALQNKEILAAGLDVFTQEPIQSDHPFLTMNNVVTLPHLGSATHETRLKRDMLGAENLVKGIQGYRPPSLINKEIWNG